MLPETLNEFEEILRGKTIKNVSAEYHRLTIEFTNGERAIIKSETAKLAPLGCCLMVIPANV